MSIEFDPKKPVSAPIKVQPPVKPNSRFLDRWVDSVYEGALKESLPSRRYCQRAWTKEHGVETRPTKAFMRTCMNEVAEFKEFCRALRKL